MRSNLWQLIFTCTHSKKKKKWEKKQSVRRSSYLNNCSRISECHAKWIFANAKENICILNIAKEILTFEMRFLGDSIITFILYIQSIKMYLIRWNFISWNQAEIHAEKMFLDFALIFTFFSLIDFIWCRCGCLFICLFVCWLCSYANSLGSAKNFQMQRRPFEQQQNHVVPTQPSLLAIFRLQKSGEQIRTFNSPWKTYYILNLRKSN